MLDKLKKSAFLKNIFFLASGTTIAQAIPMIISPLLTRLYAPESFGVLMVFTSTISILSVIATFRYEKAIIIPESEQKSKTLLVLTQYIILAVCFLLVVANALVGNQIFELIGIGNIAKYSWLIILGLFILASEQTFYHWANRLSLYKRMSASKIGSNLSSGLSSVLFGVLNLEVLGLIFSKILGVFVSLAVNAKSFAFSAFKTIKNPELKQTAVEYKKFPTLLMPSHLMNAISLNGPPILLASFYPESIVGYFALTQRVVMLPVSIIARSVGDVFRQKAAELYNQRGDYRALYLRVFGGLLLLGIIPFILLVLFGPQLFSFVFGSEWVVSGEFSQLLAILFLLQFVSSPLTNVFIISDKQQLELFWQICFLISSLLPIVIGSYYFDSINATLLLFAIMRSLVYVLSIFLTLPYTVKKNKS